MSENTKLSGCDTKEDPLPYSHCHCFPWFAPSVNLPAVGLMFTTRTQFQQACEAFIRKYETEHSVNAFTGRSRQGWRWHQHPTVAGLGYMAREGCASRRDHMSGSYSLPGDSLTERLEEDDSATLPLHTPSCETFIVQQYIVYSPTFQVPAFYFTVHDMTGSPLLLRDIIRTSLFRPHVFPRCADEAPHGISMPDSNFPLLSQGDHPVLGTPAWYLHPCETSIVVTELLDAAADGKGLASDQSLLHGMESWFLILCSVVDLRWAL